MKIEGGQDGYWWECEVHGRSEYKVQEKAEAEFLASLHIALVHDMAVLVTRPIRQHPSERRP